MMEWTINLNSFYKVHYRTALTVCSHIIKINLYLNILNNLNCFVSVFILFLYLQLIN